MKKLILATLLPLTLCFLFSPQTMLAVRAAQSWQGLDLGAAGSAGTQTVNGTQLTVTGSGLGVGASPLGGEQGRFVYQLASGDIEIVARITSLSGGPKSQAGLMLRESGNELAYMASAMFQTAAAPTTTTPNPRPYTFQRSRRATPVDSPLLDTNAGTSIPNNPPIWLKLVRVGQNYASYRSTDGRQWTPVQNYSGGAFVTSGNYQAGFIVSGGGSSASATAVFDSIYIGPPRLEYRTTWAGNTYSNDADRYVSMNLTALYVGPDGRSYTNSHYDEAGESAKVYGSDGRVQRAISGTGYNNCIGSRCIGEGSVTGDSQNIYMLKPVSASGVVYDVILQTNLNGASSVTITPATKTTIGGMAAGNGELYLSDVTNNRILVVNTTTRAELTGRSFPFTRPGAIAIDRRGNLWITQRASDHGSSVVQYTPAIRCYRPDGTFTGQEITDVVHPWAVAIDPTQDRLLVVERGPAQNIRFYALGGAAPVFTSTFGVPGGIFTGPNPGVINDPANGGWQRLYGPNGVGMDAQGNLYVSCGAVGSHLRKFDPQGNLVWQLTGLPYVDAPDFDPATDGQDLYSHRGHFALDYTQTAPGSEWRFAGMSHNLLAPAGQQRPTGANTVIRRLGPNNHRFMFTTPMKGISGSGGPLRIYRYNGEIAIPCGAVESVSGTDNFRLWVDRNGDGMETTDEYSEITPRPREFMPAFDVDAQGNLSILLMNPTSRVEQAGSNYLRVFRCLGVNEHGVPLYSFDAGAYEDQLLPFDLAYPYRFRYDSANDAMFLSGFTYDLTHKLARYDNWNSAGRRLRFLRTLPRPTGDLPATPEDNANFLYFPPYGETPDFKAGSGNNGFFSFTLDVAGDKVFLGELWGPIHVYDANLGNPVTRLIPGPEVSGVAGWTDIYMGVRAFRRSNGEYVIVREDAGIRARNLIFRWTPTTLNAAPAAPVSLKADSGTDRIHLSWEGAWGLTGKYAVWRGTAAGGETLYADNLTTPSFVDTGIQVGTKYYYRVTATNEAGTSGFSNEVSATVNTGAKFSHFDAVTEGNWKGVYGQEGHDIVGDSTSFPSHIKYSVTGYDPSAGVKPTNSPYLPPDVRLFGLSTNSEILMRASNTERLYGYWTTPLIQMELNFTDGLEHQVALYFWQTSGAKGTSTAEVSDINGNLLDRRTLASSYDGKYAVWKMSGHVRLSITLGSPYVEIGGIFVDPVSLIPSACSAGAVPTKITVHPQRVDACTKQSVTFTVQAEGQNLTYQWRKGKVPIPGATGASYTIASMVFEDNGAYDVLVTGACGTDISQLAMLPRPGAPSVTSPTDQAVEAGTTVTFNAWYTDGTVEPTIPQWQVSTNGGVTYTNIPGGTPLTRDGLKFRSTLTLPAVSLAQNGYLYRAQFTNPCSARTTSAAKLTVTSSATLTQLNLAEASGDYAGTATLSATLISSGAPVVGRMVNFSLQGTSLGSAPTNTSGVATLNGVSLGELGVGRYLSAISADFAGDDSFLPSQGLASLTVNKAVAAITLSNLSHTYDGLSKQALAVTTPAGLSVRVVYSQAGEAVNQQTDAGSYAVVATIEDDNYQGTASGALVIQKATPTINVSDGVFTYDGAQHEATGAVTGVQGESLGLLSFTYDGQVAPPVEAGTYAVGAAYAGNGNYQAAAHNTAKIQINPAAATITLSDLLQQYDGTPKSVVAATTPNGLTGVTVTYNGSSTLPTQTGSYQVAASLQHRNYTASNVLGTLVINAAPVVTARSYNVAEGGEVLLTATATDPEGGAISYAWDLNGDGVFETAGQSATFSAAQLDGPSTATARVRVSDLHGGSTVAPAVIQITNAVPVLTALVGPVEPVQVGTTVTLTGQFTDAGVFDTHTASWNWDDGGPATSGTVTKVNGLSEVKTPYVFTKAGVYEVALTVTDKDGAVVATTYKYVVVYDPSAGFVTGGGWINSPVGALRANPSLTGKAHFGFVSKYEKGANVPTGRTEFQFQAGSFNFSSTSYDWLVVAGAKAQYKGLGKVNGAGEYGFMLTATDGQMNGGGGVDKFRIKIWDKATGSVIYDNVLGSSDDLDAANPQAIGGGSIVIHSNK